MKNTILENPSCCEESNGTLIWAKKHPTMGPDKTGWCFQTMIGNVGPFWFNVDYCPFCGKRLPKQSKVKKLDGVTNAKI